MIEAEGALIFSLSEFGTFRLVNALLLVPW